MEKITIGQDINRSKRLSLTAAGEINGKVPPQAVELECSVLGALMLDEDKLFGVIDKLHEGLFYKSENKLIYNAIRKLVANRQEVDMLTVVQQLTKDGTLESAGGSYNISLLTNNIVSAAHVEFHIHILAELYMKRELIRTSTENIRDAYDSTTDAIELVNKAEKNLMEISELSFRKQSQKLDLIIADTEKKLLTEGNEEDYSVPSGFIRLDRITSGFQPGSLIILAARPAMGKTACGLTMALNIVKNFGKPVVYFSLEMTGIELLLRLVSAESSISAQKLKKVQSMNNREKELFVSTLDSMRDIPLIIDDSVGIDIFEMRAKCRRLQQQHGIKMVFIDYLQLMNSSGDSRNRNREQEVSAISRQLKEMAKELNIPVLAMSQLSRRVEDRPMGIPQSSDLRESGSLEQDADIVMAIHRPVIYGQNKDDQGRDITELANLHILKHRSGSLGIVPLRFEDRYVRFSDWHDEEDF
ncbi:MAG: replicative DNA helicase [Bacteroidales bacterium]|nr:replicative DNA helicase [Bacteroidales bacterium]